MPGEPEARVGCYLLFWTETETDAIYLLRELRVPFIDEIAIIVRLR